MQNYLLLSTFLCALLSLSCRVLSPPSAMEALPGTPAAWTSSKAAQAGVDTQWVQRFKDPALEQLVKEAITSNYDLKILGERVRQAQLRARIAGASARPQLNASLSGARQKSNFLGFPSAGSGSAYNSYNASLNFSWELDLWGRVRAAQSAEVAKFEEVRWNRRALEASLKAQVVKTYFALCEANEQVQHAKEALSINQKTRDAVADRFAVALSEEGGTGAQYRIAQSDYESAQADLARWNAEADRAARQLELLLGRYPAGLVTAKSKLPKAPTTPPSGLPSELLLRRPDILEAERALASAKQRRKEAARALFPVISLTGSAGTTSSELRDILKSSFGVWSLGAGVTQAILTGGVLQGERDQRASVEREKLISLQKTVLNAFGEVETALAQERFLVQRIEATRRAVELSRDAVAASQRDYRDGSSDILTALTAESRLIAANSALSSLRRSHLENRVNLHLALGGDYQITSK